MQTMEQYLDLVDNGRALESRIEIRPRPDRSLVALLEYADDRGPLQLEGAWRLDASVGRQLEEATGCVPAGGWRGLASLAAGCGVLSASREAFEPGRDLEEVDAWGTAEATRRLLEAFTRRLVPPTTAAGLFIMLGIHPAWGVHLAHRSHRRFGDGDGGSASERAERRHDDLFDEETGAVIEHAVFEAVAGIVGTLRALEPGEGYPLDALSGLVDSICGAVRGGALDERPERGWPGLDPFVDLQGDERSKWRVIDFTTADLVDAFLVPAGAAHRFNDGTFCVAPGAFDEVRVGAMGPDEQDGVLTRLLCESTDCRVA